MPTFKTGKMITFPGMCCRADMDFQYTHNCNKVDEKQHEVFWVQLKRKTRGLKKKGKHMMWFITQNTQGVFSNSSSY